jgi:hypothetical protein
MFEEKAMTCWGITSVDTSGHVIVGFGGDGMEVLARGETVGTRTAVDVGEGVDVRTLATREAVGAAAGVEVGKEAVGWTGGNSVPPVSAGAVLGSGLAAQAPRKPIATVSTKASPSNGFLDFSMVEAFHMGMFLPVSQLEVL